MLVWCNIQTKAAPYSFMYVRYEVTFYVGLWYVDIFLF